MLSARSQLLALIERGLVEPGNIDRALRETGVWPSDIAWRHFIERTLTWLGVLALAAALVFFIAYNWAEMGRYAKFAIVQLVMLVAIAVYTKWPDKPVLSPALLVGATVSLGVLMALFGQTYQTGADPWNLFFGWAVLMLPWALIGNSPVLWLVFIALINLAILLYQTTIGLFTLIDSASDDLFLWIMLGTNIVALVFWEWIIRHAPGSSRYGPRLIALLIAAIATFLAVIAITDLDTRAIPIALAYPVIILAGYFYYRHRRHDLFMLAVGCLSLLIVGAAALIRFVMQALPDFGGLLFVSMGILAMGASAAVWLRSVHQEFNHEPG